MTATTTTFFRNSKGDNSLTLFSELISDVNLITLTLSDLLKLFFFVWQTFIPQLQSYIDIFSINCKLEGWDDFVFLKCIFYYLIFHLKEISNWKKVAKYFPCRLEKSMFKIVGLDFCGKWRNDVRSPRFVNKHSNSNNFPHSFLF